MGEGGEIVRVAVTQTTLCCGTAFDLFRRSGYVLKAGLPPPLFFFVFSCRGGDFGLNHCCRVATQLMLGGRVIGRRVPWKESGLYGTRDTPTLHTNQTMKMKSVATVLLTCSTGTRGRGRELLCTCFELVT